MIIMKTKNEIQQKMYDLKVEINRSEELNPQIAEVLCSQVNMLRWVLSD